MRHLQKGRGNNEDNPHERAAREMIAQRSHTSCDRGSHEAVIDGGIAGRKGNVAGVGHEGGGSGGQGAEKAGVDEEAGDCEEYGGVGDAVGGRSGGQGEEARGAEERGGEQRQNEQEVRRINI